MVEAMVETLKQAGVPDDQVTAGQLQRLLNALTRAA